MLRGINGDWISYNDDGIVRSYSQDFSWYGPDGIPLSNSPHNGAKLTSYKGDPFVVGGTWHRKTEIFSWTDSNGDKNVEAMTGWEYVDDFPEEYGGFPEFSIYRYAAVSTGDAVYITTSGIDDGFKPEWSGDIWKAGSIKPANNKNFKNRGTSRGKHSELARIYQFG